MGESSRQKQADVCACSECSGVRDGWSRILVEPSPVVTRSVVGGVWWVKAVWLVCNGCGEDARAVGVGWSVMEISVSSCFWLLFRGIDF